MELPSIETPRLFLRVYVPEDLDARYAIRNDPDVYRFFPPYYLPPTKEKVREAIALSIRRWEESGLGEFGVIEKESTELIGYCGLKALDDREEIEIYYGFPKKYWGKGFATEAAQAVLKFAFNLANLSEVVGVTNPQNIASQKVLQKIGLEYQGLITCYRMDCSYFRLSREEFYK